VRRSQPRAKFILKFSRFGEQCFCRRQWRRLSKNKTGVIMLNKLLAAAAIAALAYAVSPADAARVKAACSGDNLSKTETMVENMADGAGKIAAQKEIAAAQDALLSGKAGVCATHLSKAMQAGTVNVQAGMVK
jgi:hypothetical protein